MNPLPHRKPSWQLPGVGRGPVRVSPILSQTNTPIWSQRNQCSSGEPKWGTKPLSAEVERQNQTFLFNRRGFICQGLCGANHTNSNSYQKQQTNKPTKPHLRVAPSIKEQSENDHLVLFNCKHCWDIFLGMYSWVLISKVRHINYYYEIFWEIHHPLPNKSGCLLFFSFRCSETRSCYEALTACQVAVILLP